VSPEFSPSDRLRLLALARVAIGDAIHKDGSLRDELERLEITPPLRLKRGLFVTLKSSMNEGPSRTHPLRGCIGVMASELPVYRTVAQTAPKAALDDPRFPALTATELDALRISISVLSPPRRIESIDELTVGRDGVQLERGFHRAVFLPQVAEEQGWRVQQLLEQLSLKAGLDKQAWRDATLSSFQAEVFGES